MSANDPKRTFAITLVDRVEMEKAANLRQLLSRLPPSDEARQRIEALLTKVVSAGRPPQ
jgi:hypothetical protein